MFDCHGQRLLEQPQFLDSGDVPEIEGGESLADRTVHGESLRLHGEGFGRWRCTVAAPDPDTTRLKAFEPLAELTAA
jgi:hypothetical protein